MTHESCSHDAGNAWTIEPTRRYFKRCDTCHTFRPWANYYEVYYYDADSEETCWWWECTGCLIKTISDYAEVWRLEPEEMSATDILNQLATSLENLGEKEIAARVRTGCATAAHSDD